MQILLSSEDRFHMHPADRSTLAGEQLDNAGSNHNHIQQAPRLSALIPQPISMQLSPTIRLLSSLTRPTLRNAQQFFDLLQLRLTTFKFSPPIRSN
jgi:hypothetical protein